MIQQEYPYIYESPDGGKTVYRRPLGGKPADRELHWISPELQAKQDLDALWMKWIPILRDSREDPILKEMLDKILIYHHLKDIP